MDNPSGSDVLTTTATANGGARASVLAAATGIVGADRVVGPISHDSAITTLGPNVGQYGQRAIGGVIRPRAVADVRRVVEIFDRSPHAGALHPISTGYNWGLGSREPAQADSVVLDLSGLDQIRALDIDAGWAVVEPGVTQGRLARRLRDTGRMVNLTSSSMHTSVVGNALDRGVGLLHQRVDDLAGLEVVLPNGELLHVGWWPTPGRPTPVYSHGLGPSLLPLFVQSNLGVVTAAVIRLPPRPDVVRVIRLNFVAANLRPAMIQLRRWTAQGLVSGVPKVYDPIAAKAYRGTEGLFLVHVCVAGTATTVALRTAAIVDEAAGSGRFAEISDVDTANPDPDVNEVATLVEHCYAGEPDTQDVMFRAKMRCAADAVDHGAGGFRLFVPLVPFTAEAIAHAGELLGRVHELTGIRCSSTMNVLGPDIVDFAVMMRFEPNHEQTRSADRALDLLYELFAEAGFVPYRLDVDHAEWIDRLDPDPAARHFARWLKQELDPNNVIAPGRYG